MRHRSLLLGTESDDGVDVPDYLFYNFGLIDLAVTLQRFLYAYNAFGWVCNGVAPLEPAVYPVAAILAARLKLPLAPVQAGGLQVFLEFEGRPPHPGLTFALGARDKRNLPHVVGVVTGVSVPWTQSDDWWCHVHCDGSAGGPREAPSESWEQVISDTLDQIAVGHRFVEHLDAARHTLSHLKGPRFEAWTPPAPPDLLR